MNSEIVRTLLGVSGLVSLVLAGILLYASKRSKTYGGFQSWTVAFLMNGLGIISFALRGVLPLVVTVSFANFAILLYLISIHYGFRQFFDLNSRKWILVYVSSIILHTLWYICFTYVVPNVAMRMGMGFLCYALYYMDSLRQVVTYSKRVIPQRQWLFISMFGIVALWMVVVVAVAVVARVQVQYDANTGLIAGITLLVNLTAHIFGVFGMILINNQRLYIDFEQSHQQVEELSGLIPICSNCKKIRDDSGYWDHLEGYLEDHTGLVLSHSVCPDCIQKLYPNLEISGKIREGEEEKE